MFENAFKRIDDVLWKDAGCRSEINVLKNPPLNDAFIRQVTSKTPELGAIGSRTKVDLHSISTLGNKNYERNQTLPA